jgi:hypothetical protein
MYLSRRAALGAVLYAASAVFVDGQLECFQLVHNSINTDAETMYIGTSVGSLWAPLLCWLPETFLFAAAKVPFYDRVPRSSLLLHAVSLQTLRALSHSSPPCTQPFKPSVHSAIQTRSNVVGLGGRPISFC